MALVHQREICSSESGSESNGSPLIRERIRIQRQSAHQGADQHRSVFCSSGSGQRRPSQRQAGASGASRNLPSLRQTVVPQLRQTVALPLRQTVVSDSQSDSRVVKVKEETPSSSRQTVTTVGESRRRRFSAASRLIYWRPIGDSGRTVAVRPGADKRSLSRLVVPVS